MKRVTIYVDGDKWKDVKEHAWRRRVSAGAYLMDLHRLDVIDDPFDPEPHLSETTIVRDEPIPMKDPGDALNDIDLTPLVKEISLPADYLECGNCGSEVLDGDLCDCQKEKPKGAIKSAAIARGKANLGKSDPVAKVAADLEDLTKKRDVVWSGGYSKEKQVGKVKK